jgi:hypothetical protein
MDVLDDPDKNKAESDFFNKLKRLGNKGEDGRRDSQA